MGAKADLHRVLSQRLVPLMADLERVVFRNGYVRVLAVAVGSLGVVGALGEFLGQRWLRTVFATAAAVFFVLAAAISFAATQRLRVRMARSEAILHDYADALRTNSPITVLELHEEVIIAANGDAEGRRELVLDDAADDVPRHLSLGLVHYGPAELTAADRRRVACTVRHAGADSPGQGTRADATSVWTTSAEGKAQLDIYVHLGTSVRRGDVVTVQWSWPEYSAALMRGDAPESFDVLFTKKIERFSHEVTFRGTGRSDTLKIRKQGPLELCRERRGTDTVVRFGATDPPIGEHFGFVADLSEN